MIKKYILQILFLFALISCNAEKETRNSPEDNVDKLHYGVISSSENLEAFLSKKLGFFQINYDKSSIDFEKQPHLVSLLFGHESETLGFTLEKKGLEYFENVPYKVSLEARKGKIPVGIVYFYTNEPRLKVLKIHASR